jgi:peptide deformylase
MIRTMSSSDQPRYTEAERARRLAAYREIRLWGDPVLRLKAAAVSTFDEVLGHQAQRLARTMVAVHGAGLAAPQVGRLTRLIVYRLPDDPEGDQIRILVNPAIADASPETEAFTEGCLSMPGIFAEVVRPARVVVEAQGLDGNGVEVSAEGPHSSLLQHEIDHLDGVLLPDRLAREEKRRYLRDVAEAERAAWPAIDPPEARQLYAEAAVEPG